jgi:hypothetical protein
MDREVEKVVEVPVETLIYHDPPPEPLDQPVYLDRVGACAPRVFAILYLYCMCVCVCVQCYMRIVCVRLRPVCAPACADA